MSFDGLKAMTASWVARLFHEIPPGSEYAKGRLPPSLGEARCLVDRHRIADLLPYESYDPDTHLFYNDDSVSFMLEVAPAVGLSEEDLRVLSGLLTIGLRAKTTFQFILYASHDIHPLLNRWEAMRSKAKGIFSFLARKRVDYLKTGSWRSLFSDQPMLVRDYRLFLVLSRPLVATMTNTNKQGWMQATTQGNTTNEAEWLQRIRAAFKGILSSARLPSADIDAEALINLMDTIINPNPDQRNHLRWEQNRMLREQMADGDTRYEVGRDSLGISHGEHHVEARMFSVRQYPETWAGWGMGDLIGDLFSNALRIPCPFLYTLNVVVPDQVAAANKAKYKTARAQQMTESHIGRYLPAWKERKDDWSFVSKKVGDGHNLMDVQMQLVLFSLQGEGDYAEQRLKALFGSRGWVLSKNRFISTHAWLSALPMMLGPSFVKEMKALRRFRTMLTWSTINTTPIIGEWKGTGTPLLLLLGRRGQVMFIDPFDNDKGNFNVSVAGASGAGKSVFTQEVISGMLGTGGRAWVIDSGRSYEHICNLIGGVFLDFSESSRVNLNPFTTIRDIEEEMPMLKDVLAQMASPGQSLNSLQKAYLEEAIKHVWKERGQQTSVTPIAELLLGNEDLAAREVGRMLYPYTSEGTYGGYFEGQSNIDFDNPFVVLELGGLDSKPDLQSVVLLILMMRITEAMYQGSRKQRKLCIIDEAWKLMAHGSAGDFIERGYRTARKFGGAFMTITQGINDYYKSGTSEAALANSDWLFLLRQKPESIQAAEKSDQIKMDEHLRRLMTSIDMLEGKYAEIAVMGPGGVSVGRLVVDPFAEKLYSTKATEFEQIDQMLKQGVSLVEAVDELVKTESKR